MGGKKSKIAPSRSKPRPQSEAANQERRLTAPQRRRGREERPDWLTRATPMPAAANGERQCLGLALPLAAANRGAGQRRAAPPLGGATAGGGGFFPSARCGPIRTRLTKPKATRQPITARFSSHSPRGRKPPHTCKAAPHSPAPEGTGPPQPISAAVSWRPSAAGAAAQRAGDGGRGLEAAGRPRGRGKARGCRGEAPAALPARPRCGARR